MKIQFNNTSIDISTKSLDESKISVQKGGRRFKVDGLKNARLNDLLRRVICQLKHQKPEDLAEAKDLLDRFTKIANKGYEPDGIISKLPFFIRWIAHVKHFYGQWRRKHLFNNLNKTINLQKDLTEKLSKKNNLQSSQPDQKLKHQQQQDLKPNEENQVDEQNPQSSIDQQEIIEKSESLAEEIANLEKDNLPHPASYSVKESPNLPDEMLLEIFNRADPKSISSLSLINKQFLKVSKGKDFKLAIGKQLLEIAMKIGQKERANLSIVDGRDDINEVNLVHFLSIIENPDKAKDIIEKTSIDSLECFICYHTEKILFLNEEQIREILQLIQQKIGINPYLIVAYTNTGNFDLAWNCFKEAMLSHNIVERDFLLDQLRLLLKKNKLLVSDWIQLIIKDLGCEKSLEILDFLAVIESERIITKSPYIHAAIEGYISIGSITRAEEFLLKPNRLDKPYIIYILVSLANNIQQKDHNGALKVLETLLRNIENHYLATIDELEELQKKDNNRFWKILETLRITIKYFPHLGPVFKLAELLKVANIYAKFDTEKAKSLLDQIESDDYTFNYPHLIIGLAEAYILIDVKKTVSLLRKLEEPTP